MLKKPILHNLQQTFVEFNRPVGYIRPVNCTFSTCIH